MRVLTPKDLKQLKALKTEVEHLAIDILNLRPEYVTDSVKDYRSGYPRTITISGISVDKEGRLRRRLEHKQEDLQEEIWKLENYLDTVEDSEMRQILRLHYRNGLTQSEIGKELGYTRSAIAMKIERFFNKI